MEFVHFQIQRLSLQVTDCTVIASGGGYLDVTGGVGLEANNARINVRNVTGNQGNGAYAVGGGNITVRGKAQGSSYAARASGADSVIKIEGDAKSTGSGSTVVEGSNGGYIEVNGNVTTSAGSTGVNASNSGKVYVKGSVSAAQNGVTVNGNADTQATVDGSITASGNNAYGIKASGGSVSVGGDVKAEAPGSTGIYADGSKVTVAGDVSTGAEGVYAANAAQVTIEGDLTISGGVYIEFENSTAGSEDYTTDPDKPGYRKYTDGESTVWVKEAPAIADVCEMGGTEYATLDAALAAVTDSTPATIKLLADIEHYSPIIVNNQDITFNLNGYDLTVDTQATKALEILNNGKVAYTGIGSFIVKGYWCGVYMDGGEAAVTSTSGESTNNNSVGAHVQNSGKLSIAGSATGCRWGVFAEGNSEISIGGNAIATASIPYDSCGAQAESGSIITVVGKAESEDNGIYVSGPGSKTTVGSVFSKPSDDSTRTAAHVENQGQADILGVTGEEGTAIFVTSGGQVTIGGIIRNVGNNSKYIRIYAEEFVGSPAGRTIPTTKSGYHTYSTENGTVWVKDNTATANVCAIDSTDYAMLADALAAVTDTTPTTIKLLANIEHYSPITASNQDITFNLNGYDLTVDTSADPESTALVVLNQGSVDYTGSGAFNIIGAECGVSVRDTNSAATVTNVDATEDDGDAVRASFGGAVIVKGNVVYSGDSDINNDSGYGISIVSSGSVTVNGSVTANGVNGQGMCITNGTVVITGNVTATKRGIFCYNTADVTVDGNITVNSANFVGIDAGGSSTVRIGGNVTAIGST